MAPKRVAVVGGGIFGVTTAYLLATHGVEVHLFERNRALLEGASGINQYRLHRGYHYPRSDSTAVSSKRSETTFRSLYGDCVFTADKHLYAIAARDTKTTTTQFEAFCDRIGLFYEPWASDALRPSSVAATYRAEETLIDIQMLRRRSQRLLEASGVKVHLGVRATRGELDGFDHSVNATYASLNRLLRPEQRRPYQFEICEKPVVRAPASLRNLSVVVLDGPFMCIDPIGRGEESVLGNVVHAIHHSNVGNYPEVPPAIEPLMNRGVIPDPPVTNIRSFLGSASEFLPEIEAAEHIGSMFTVRAVLPNVDETDERPTLVHVIDERTVTLFSGKIGTCVEAARNVVHSLADELGITADRVLDEQLR